MEDNDEPQDQPVDTAPESDIQPVPDSDVMPEPDVFPTSVEPHRDEERYVFRKAEDGPDVTLADDGPGEFKSESQDE